MPRRKAVLTSAALSLAVAGSLAAAAAAPPASAIAGGSNATLADAPYQVSILAASGFGWAYLCGGILRDANAVITAAHCLVGRGASELEVQYGGTDRTRLPRTSAVSALIWYPSFNVETLVGDVGLLKLSTPVQESNGVEFAKLASSAPAAGAVLTVSGWGLTSDASTKFPIGLQVLQESVDTTAGCKAQYGGLNVDPGGDEGGPLAGLIPVLDTSSMFCGRPAAAGQGICRGDSGGPAVADGVVVGVASWGTTDCGDGADKVYTSVARYRNFLLGGI